jgi:hypothetical protein
VTATWFAKFGLLVLAAAYCMHAQTREQAHSLQEFYQALVAEGHSAPSLEALTTVTKQIYGAHSEEITKALPAIFTALAHQDEGVKHNACTALFEIARRPDGAALLRNHVNEVGQLLLTSPNPDTRAGTLIILGTLQPPPPEVVPIFLNVLKRTDADIQAQGPGIIFELVHIAPEKAEVIAAVREFLSRPLDTKSKVDVLNALGDPRVKDARIIAIVISSLDDSDPGTRVASTQALMGMGQSALQQAEPALQRLANDPGQPANVVAEAKTALQKLRPSQR